MARGRMISKTLGSSQRFQAVAATASTQELGLFYQLVFVLIVSHADDWGRLEGDAFTIKHRIFPVSERSESEFASALSVLHEAGLIVWYEVQRKHILEVVNFSEHQTGLHKRTASKFPDPPTYARRVRRVTSSPSPPDLEEDPLTRRTRDLVEAYKQQYHEERKKPYLQHRMQGKKDFDAAKQLCMAYDNGDVVRIITQYLRLPNDHPKIKFLQGGQRTLPSLLTQAAEIAETLDIQGVVA